MKTIVKTLVLGSLAALVAPVAGSFYHVHQTKPASQVTVTSSCGLQPSTVCNQLFAKKLGQ